MNKLQPMAADEQATLKSIVSTTTGHLPHEVTEVMFTVKENGEKGTPRYNLTWLFDFGNVTVDEVMLLATRSLRIDGQADWRKAKDKMDADVWQDRKWSVRSMLDQARQKASPAVSAEKALDKLSKSEREALFAKYM